MNGFIGTEPTVAIAGLGWIGVSALLAALLWLTVKRPAWGFAAVVAMTPLYQFRGELLVPTTLLELAIGTVFLAWLFQIKKYPPRPDRSWIWLAVAVLGGLVAAFVSPDRQMGLGLWRAFWLEPALFYVAAQAVFRTERTTPLLYGLLGSLGIITVWSVLRAVLGTDLAYDGRLVGSYQSANFLAMAVVPVFLAALFWSGADLPTGRYRRVAVRFVPLVLSGGLLLASQSRGGALAVLAGTLVGAWYWHRHLSFRQGAWLALGVGGITAVIAPFLFSRPAPIVPVRRLLWERSVEFITAHPLTGIGPNQFQARLNERFAGDVFLERYFLPFAPNSHNLFLVLWIDWGLAGLVGFLGLVAWAVHRIITRWDRVAVVPAAMLAAMMVHGLVDTPVLKNDLAILFMTVLVLVGTLRQPSVRTRKAPR